MEVANMGRKCFTILVVFVVLQSLDATKVPALIWSPTRSLRDLPQSLAGKTISSTDFSKNYLTPLTSGKNTNLVIFTQDKLSLQDFTQHADVYNPDSDGGAFKNLKGFMDDHFSINLPSVHLPSSAVGEIAKDFKGKVHHIKGKDVNDLDLDSKQSNLIIITLSSVSESPSEEKAFSENDQIIGKICHALKKRGVQYTAIYTAKNSQAVDSSTGQVKRHLLASDDISYDNVNNATLINSTCMLLYFRSIKADISKGKVNMTVMVNSQGKYTDTGSYCSNSTEDNNGTKIMFEYAVQNSTLKLDFQMDMGINNKTGDWSIVNAVVKVSGNTSLEGETKIPMTAVWAPITFSYHCSLLENIQNDKKTNESTVNITLSFDGLQLQPYNVTDFQFSDAWDCVPFFSEVIWMGIVCILVLTVILLFGFSMLSSINTMDKFDDPKGKTITVNVNE